MTPIHHGENPVLMNTSHISNLILNCDATARQTVHPLPGNSDVLSILGACPQIIFQTHFANPKCPTSDVTADCMKCKVDVIDTSGKDVLVEYKYSFFFRYLKCS